MSKTKDTQPTEMIYGSHALQEVLNAKKRKVRAVYVSKNPPKAWNALASQLPSYVIVHHVDKQHLDKLAQTTDHQSVVAIVAPFVYRKKFFDPTKDTFLVMLDGIQDPRNVGAIVRSAYCTGADGIIINQKQSSPLTATAIKASAGLAEHCEIYLAPSASAALQELKSAGYALYTTALDTKSKNALTLNYQGPLCIIIGSEGTGVSNASLKAGTTIILPQRAADISYNASVAAGIICFIIGTQLKKI